MEKALNIFLHLFPSTRVKVYDDELRYTVSNGHAAMWFEAKAQKIILENGLPLVADLEEWGPLDRIFERYISVKMAPEEYEYADEAQDDELLSGGWWNKCEE